MWDERTISWSWSGETIELGLTHFGSGRPILLLPALSSISTRHEMRALQARLGGSFETIAVDWPGFGDRARPSVAWRPDTYRAFLDYVLRGVVPGPFATIAAGHAAGYVLDRAASRPGCAGRLCLVAPTWRGPLPTMTGKRLPLFERIARAADVPILGGLLYRLNVNRPMLGIMARGHVYADPSWLTPPRLMQKLNVARARGARHASVRFVTGMLDPMLSRTEWVAVAGSVSDPILIVLGAGTPPRSRAEMEALRGLPQVQFKVLPEGKLAIHEEFPDAVGDAIERFLRKTDPSAPQAQDRKPDQPERLGA